MHDDDAESAGANVSTQIVSITTKPIMEMINVASENERNAKGYKSKSAVLFSSKATYQKLKESGKGTMPPPLQRNITKRFSRKRKQWTFL